ncbi:uncharacterized protein EI97DRAFT_427737 [Westerdykella ornata]|uniref:Uncharacterized protein n=1 Tax=Westerdykella ornata TaxID=318751 RepID=A0A6A6J546_WESOR|nr:uncharacterized protein EI97DRAFT_427737 [Westerdykella ornata]KAF2271710.1 hypothetical protein EI97DRAFT_427737 [Westerdykella ornata]
MAHWNSTLMLFYFLHILSTAFQVNAHYWFFPRAPGVAFGLTPDYGQVVAAIHLKDGTTVPIARIQGRPDYQAFMRKRTTSTTHDSSTLCRWFSPVLNVLPSALGLDVNICHHPDVNSVKTLLGTLKVAVESYLGTNFCYAALSFDHVQKNYEESVAREALRALGVSPILGVIQAAKCEILSREPRGEPDFDAPGYEIPEPRTVLAIDYSLHWFNVGMYTFDEGVILDPVEGTVVGPTIEKDNQLQALKESLEHLFAKPPPEFNLPEDIHQLLVYGDDSHNEALYPLLENFLGADLVRNANISTSVFDGVAFLAEAAHDYMNDVQFEEKVRPHFGCMWRSKLYRKPGHSEL